MKRTAGCASFLAGCAVEPEARPLSQSASGRFLYMVAFSRLTRSELQNTIAWRWGLVPPSVARLRTEGGTLHVATGRMGCGALPPGKNKD